MEIDTRFYSDCPIKTINAFFVLREIGTGIRDAKPVSRIGNASLTSFVSNSVIIITTTSLFDARSVIVSPYPWILCGRIS